jgi:hypothetical protein
VGSGSREREGKGEDMIKICIHEKLLMKPIFENFKKYFLNIIEKRRGRKKTCKDYE